MLDMGECIVDMAGAQMMQEFGMPCDLVTGSTCFEKRPYHLIIFISIKVTSGEEIVAKQHHLLVWFPCWAPPPPEKTFVPHLTPQGARGLEYHNAFVTEMTFCNASGSGIEEVWRKLKSRLLEAAENVFRST